MMQSKSWYRYLTASVFLAVYVFSFIQEGHIHLHHHADEAHASHNDQCEDDACHVAIYHYGSSGCDHKAHYIPAEEPCYDCHEFLQVQHVDENPVKEVALDDHTPQEFVGMDLCDHFGIRDTNVRGPPTTTLIS